jgi:hypothetical protein
MSETLPVPEECRGCPILDRALEELAMIDFARDYLLMAMDHIVGEGAIEPMLYDFMEKNDISPERRDAYKSLVMKLASTDIDDLGGHIETLEKRRDDLTATCVGAYALQGFNEADKHEYRITTCTSEVVHESGQQVTDDEHARSRHEPTRIITEAYVERREY